MTFQIKLLGRFQEAGYRHTYVDSFSDAFIATQLKVLREQRGLTQTALANLAGMRQSQISEMEDINHRSWKVSTLKRLARALDLVLVVRFDSFGDVFPELDRLTRKHLERVSFSDDPVFNPHKAQPDEVLEGHTLPTVIGAGLTGRRLLHFQRRAAATTDAVIAVGSSGQGRSADDNLTETDTSMERDYGHG